MVTADEGDGGNTAVTTASTKRLIRREKVHAACGAISSANLVAVAGLFRQAKIPFLSTYASPAAVQGRPYGWRTSWATNHPAQVIGEYVAKRSTGPVAAILADHVEAHDLLSGFRKTFEPAGGRLAGDPVAVPFPIRGGSFEPYLRRVEQQNPAAVVGLFAGADALKFVRQYRDLGLAERYQLYAPGMLTEGLLAAEGTAARGIVSSLNYAPDLDNAANRAFVSEFETAYHSPPTCLSVAAYDAGWVLDRAIRACWDDVRGVRLEREIGNLGRIDSPRGPWTFGRNRSPRTAVVPARGAEGR